MRKQPPPPSPERDLLIKRLGEIWLLKRELWTICVQDKKWTLQLFPTALYLEDDPRFNRWFEELLEVAQVPWEAIPR